MIYSSFVDQTKTMRNIKNIQYLTDLTKTIKDTFEFFETNGSEKKQKLVFIKKKKHIENGIDLLRILHLEIRDVFLEFSQH